MKGGFEIRRVVRRQKIRAVTKTSCPLGYITILTDEEGEGAMMPYTQALDGKSTDDQFQFFLEENEYSIEDKIRVGFSEALPERSGIGEFFQACGYTEDHIPQLLTEYDLEEKTYLNCGQLPLTETRQLLLLQRLKSDHPVLVMNDPFSPFNGRWKEHFAEKILEFVLTHDCAVVVVNLSFAPRSWDGQDRIRFIDVGKAAVRAAQQAEQQAKMEEAALAAAAAIKEETKTSAEQTQSSLTAQASGNSSDPKSELPFELPEHFAYKEVVDWLFAPLARVSHLFRGYGGVLVPLGIAVLMVTMGFVMFPNMLANREKLQKMATTFTFEQQQDVEPKFPKKGDAISPPQLQQHLEIVPDRGEFSDSEMESTSGELSPSEADANSNVMYKTEARRGIEGPVHGVLFSTEVDFTHSSFLRFLESQYPKHKISMCAVNTLKEDIVHEDFNKNSKQSSFE